MYQIHIVSCGPHPLESVSKTMSEIDLTHNNGMRKVSIYKAHNIKNLYKAVLVEAAKVFETFFNWVQYFHYSYFFPLNIAT